MAEKKTDTELAAEKDAAELAKHPWKFAEVGGMVSVDNAETGFLLVSGKPAANKTFTIKVTLDAAFKRAAIEHGNLTDLLKAALYAKAAQLGLVIASGGSEEGKKKRTRTLISIDC